MAQLITSKVLKLGANNFFKVFPLKTSLATSGESDKITKESNLLTLNNLLLSETIALADTGFF